MENLWCEDFFIDPSAVWCEDEFTPYSEIIEEKCFWCEKGIPIGAETLDHLIPRCMGTDGKTVICCYECNQERGKVTEFYSQRKILIENISKFPNKATSYKNRFRKRVIFHSDIISKWLVLHIKKDIKLPFDILDMIKLDEIMPTINFKNI